MKENYYRITEEQELLVENLQEVLKREVPESYILDCYLKEKNPERLYDALANNGYSMLGIPEEYGGVPCTPMTHILVNQTIARHGAPTSLNALMVDMILEYGSQEQKDMALTYVKKGRAPFCLAFTEPSSGSDSMSIMTTATKKNGKVYINGQKTFISWGMTTPNILCITRDLDNPKAHEAMSMWLFPSDLKGITKNKQHKIGMRLANTCEIFFDNVEIPENSLIGKEGGGFLQLMKNFELERVVSCSGALGIAEACYEDAVRYANQRVQFGKVIGEFQLTQLKLTEMYTKIENMKNMIYKAAWDKENGNSIRLSSSIIKRYCARSAFEVADDAMQILGGIGYCDDHRVSRMWADTRVRRIAAGTDEVMIHTAGRLLLKQFK